MGNRETYVNREELRVVGMSRSGNHAIIHWILAQAEGRTCFVNAAEPKTNPFASARPMGNGERFEASYPDFDPEAERRGRHSGKDLLVHSYEDCFLGMVASPVFEENHDRWVGPSARRRDVLILRDPFNLFASRMRLGYQTISPHTEGRIWKQHARQYLGRRKYLDQEVVPVSYDRWASERDYRRELASRLGLEFTDAGRHTVPSTAGGSSFDGRRFHGKAAHMPIFDRWRHYRDDPAWRARFDDPLLELAEAGFGHHPELAEAFDELEGVAMAG